MTSGVTQSYRLPLSFRSFPAHLSLHVEMGEKGIKYKIFNIKVVVVMSGTYGSDPAGLGFLCNGVGFIGWGFGVWPGTTNCPLVLHTVFLPLQPTLPISFSPRSCIIFAAVIISLCRL